MWGSLAENMMEARRKVDAVVHGVRSAWEHILCGGYRCGSSEPLTLLYFHENFSVSPCGELIFLVSFQEVRKELLRKLLVVAFRC